MNDAAWERLTDGIDIKLGINKHGQLKRPLEDRPEVEELIEFIEFERDGDKYKLERSTGPAIIDRKTHYSHRPGVASRVENIYDDSETAHKVTLFKLVGGEWEEIDLNNLSL